MYIRVCVFCLVILSGCYRCHQGIHLLCSIMINRMPLSGGTQSLSAPLTVSVRVRVEMAFLTLLSSLNLSDGFTPLLNWFF